MTNELSVKCLLARENINMHEGGWVPVNGVNSSLIRWETARLSITWTRQKANQAGAFEKCVFSVHGVGGIFLLNPDLKDFSSHILLQVRAAELLAASILAVWGERCSLLLLIVNKNENV